jgi:PAS domain S-box-containing protein
MLRTSNAGLFFAFVLIVALLVGNSWISYHNIVQLRDQAGAVQHTHEVVQSILDVGAAIRDAETGQRGYLLTEDVRYLEPYHDGQARIEPAFARVSALIGDSPEQAERLKALRSSTQAKLRELGDSIDVLDKEGFAAARKLLMNDLGLFEMTEVRSISARMIEAENALLAQRSADAEQSFRSAIASSFLSAGASIVLFALAAFLIRRNIASRTRAAAALTERNDLLRTTLASVVEGVVVTDASGMVTFMNPIAESLTGARAQDVEGRSLSTVLEIHDEATRAPLESRAVEVLHGTTPSVGRDHRIIVARDGGEAAIEESAVPLVDPRGSRIGVVLTLHDVTEQRRNEREIADARRYAERIVDTIPDPLLILDAQLCVRSANLAYFALFRTTMSQAVNRSLFQAGPSRWDETAVRALLDIDPGDDDMRTAEIDHILTPGDARILRLNARRLHGAGAHLDLIMLAIRDVTEPRTNERRIKQLLAAEQEYASRLRFIAAASLTLNSAHSRDSVLGVLRDEARRILSVDEVVVELGTATDKDAPIVPGNLHGSASIAAVETPQGAEPAVEDTFLSAPLTGHGGRTIGQVHLRAASPPGRSASENDRLILNQLVQVASIAVENARLYEELREGDRRKNEFLATLAHELRNPLAPVRNSVQILLSPRVAEADREWAVTAIDHQITLLVRLVDDLLDVSRITRGKVMLKREHVDLNEILAQALEISRPVIHASGNTLSVQPLTQSVMLHVDPARIAQVLANLLNNAAKYTESGGTIRLTCEVEDGDLVIRVRDNGIGIPPEMLPRIFDMFWQVDHSFERAQGGLGIGLTLVRQLVDLHGGSVSVHSQGTGFGSEFTVRLPAVAERSIVPFAVPKAPVVAHLDGSGALRILVVDDNHDSAHSMALFLRLEGHDVGTAHDGVEALEVERELEPRLVLLDLGLPRKNGYDTAREIRARRGPAVTIVAMTGWSQAEHRGRALEAGFDRHLVKPVDPELLRELLSELDRGSG